MANEIFILTKSILPLPDKYRGLRDEEEKFRKRYLDIMMNEDVREIFIKKQKYTAAMRNFLTQRGFLEIELLF